jgi:predicted aconitase
LFESLVERDGRFVVPTTLNVLSADRRTVGRSAELHAKEQMQLGILDACRRMGALTTCSCNPFLLGFNPAFGESVAWNESASAPYVNAVLGARTNREGATALASALTGYTVEYGMHVVANRRGSVIIEVDADVQGSDAFAVLGGAVARACGGRIPVIEGIAAPPTLDEYTAFCASFATVGPLASFHMVGITPEAPTRAAALGDAKDSALPATIRINGDDLVTESGRYSTAKNDRVDVVAVGCPHASLDQIREVVAAVGSAQVHPDTLFVVQTSAAICEAGGAGRARRIAWQPLTSS